MTDPSQNHATILPGRRVWQLAGIAFLLLALALVVFWGTRGHVGIHVGNGHAAGMNGDDILARLEAIEKRQARQDELINRQLAFLSHAAKRGSLSPDQALRKEQERAHVRRMQDDPVYARQVQEQELAELQQAYAQEPVDQRWSAETRAMTGDAMVSAAVQAGAKIKDADVDCRSSSCRITFSVDAKYAYDDVLTYLMTDLAETLPNARLVVMPVEDGARKVNIFADNHPAPPRPGGS